MTAVTPAAACARAGRREWAGLAVLALPTMVVAMDLTVLHLAAPAISTQLRPSGGQLLWILDVYGFLTAGCLMAMGALGDRFGRRRLLLTGAAAFAVASVLAAYAPTAETLIAARALLGVAGATLMPSTLALLSSLFTDPAQRTFAVAVWMTCFVAGEAVGPLAGGALLQYFWWGSVFLIAVPVMAVLLWAGPRLLPEHRAAAHSLGPFDVAGAALSLAAVLSFVHGVKSLSGTGLGPAPLAWVVIGAVAAAAFVRRQRRAAHPLVDLALFRLPAFRAALGTLTLTVAAMAGTQLLLMQYLQAVLGLSPLEAGLWTLPAITGGIAGTLLAPRLAARAGRHTVIAGGLLLAAAGTPLILFAGPHGGLPWAVTGFAVLYTGVTPTLALTTDAIVRAAPEKRAGLASAVSESGAELGLALGMALFGSLGLTVYRTVLTDRAPESLPPTALNAAQETIASAVSTAHDLPAALGSPLLTAAQAAFTTSLHLTAAATSAALLLATALLRPWRTRR